MQTEFLQTLNWIEEGETQPDPAHLLWEGRTQDGDWVVLLTIPGLHYVLATRSESLYGQTAISIDDLKRDYELVPDYISLGRPDARQLGVALITALINNSEQIIDSYIQETTAKWRAVGGSA